MSNFISKFFLKLWFKKSLNYIYLTFIFILIWLDRFVFTSWFPIKFPDTQSYIEFAYHRLPAYGFLLSFFENYTSVVYLQSIIGFLVIFFLCTALLTHYRLIFFILFFAFLIISNSNFLFAHEQIHVFSLYASFINLFIALFLLSAKAKNPIPWLFVASLSMSLALTIRPTAVVLFIPLLIGVMLIPKLKFKRIKASIVVFIPYISIIIILSIYNYKSFKALTPFTRSGQVAVLNNSTLIIKGMSGKHTDFTDEIAEDIGKFLKKERKINSLWGFGRREWRRFSSLWWGNGANNLHQKLRKYSYDNRFMIGCSDLKKDDQFVKKRCLDKLGKQIVQNIIINNPINFLKKIILNFSSYSLILIDPYCRAKASLYENRELDKIKDHWIWWSYHFSNHPNPKIECENTYVNLNYFLQNRLIADYSIRVILSVSIMIFSLLAMIYYILVFLKKRKLTSNSINIIFLSLCLIFHTAILAYSHAPLAKYMHSTEVLVYSILFIIIVNSYNFLKRNFLLLLKAYF